MKNKEYFDKYGNYKMPNQFESDIPNTLNNFKEFINSYKKPDKFIWLIYVNKELVQICGNEERKNKEIINWKQATGETVTVEKMEVYE